MFYCIKTTKHWINRCQTTNRKHFGPMSLIFNRVPFPTRSVPNFLPFKRIVSCRVALRIFLRHLWEVVRFSLSHGAFPSRAAKRHRAKGKLVSAHLKRSSVLNEKIFNSVECSHFPCFAFALLCHHAAHRKNEDDRCFPTILKRPSVCEWVLVKGCCTASHAA